MTELEIDIIRTALFIGNLECSSKSRDKMRKAIDIMEREYTIKQMELKGPVMYKDVGGNRIPPDEGHE